jgi:hypothetical protein
LNISLDIAVGFSLIVETHPQAYRQAVNPIYCLPRITSLIFGLKPEREPPCFCFFQAVAITVLLAKAARFLPLELLSVEQNLLTIEYLVKTINLINKNLILPCKPLYGIGFQITILY